MKGVALILTMALGFGGGCSGPGQFGRAASEAPIALAEGVFDHAQPGTLGLPFVPGAETFTVYRAAEGDYRYNHGAVVIGFQGRLYMQWQSSARDEDAPETQVRYAVSSDGGSTWSQPEVLAEPRTNAVVTNGGWRTDGETLIAYINVWPTGLEPRGGYVEYRASTDGKQWSAMRDVTNAEGEPLAGIIEQDTRALPGNRLLTTVHRQPGLVAKPYYTDDPLGLTGWREGRMNNLEASSAVSRELEPSWFVRDNGEVVMVFRDQASSFKLLASVSKDQGETWNRPVETNFPDSRAKQSAGNLPNGHVFIVNNPSGSKTRIPLTITLSRDGRRFDEAYLLRAGGNDLQSQQFQGKYKRAGYSYPKSYVDDDYLYVAYATNKEDIEVTRVPVDVWEEVGGRRRAEAAPILPPTQDD